MDPKRQSVPEAGAYTMLREVLNLAQAERAPESLYLCGVCRRRVLLVNGRPFDYYTGDDQDSACPFCGVVTVRIKYRRVPEDQPPGNVQSKPLPVHGGRAIEEDD